MHTEESYNEISKRNGKCEEKTFAEMQETKNGWKIKMHALLIPLFCLMSINADWNHWLSVFINIVVAVRSTDTHVDVAQW